MDCIFCLNNYCAFEIPSLVHISYCYVNDILIIQSSREKSDGGNFSSHQSSSVDAVI